jgi:hypothetical protein
MVNKSTLVFFVAAVSLCPASMAFGQTQEYFGPVLPMTYDAQGGRHFCMYGYYGPLAPPMPSSNKIAVCCNNMTVVSGKSGPRQDCQKRVRR